MAKVANRKQKAANTPTRILEIVPTALYTSSETANFLRMQRQTLEVWRCTDRYPILNRAAVKVGGRVHYRGAGILAFLESPHEKAKPYIPKNPHPILAMRRVRRSSGTKRGSR